MSKILVTGGAGFIGSNLVDALIEASHEVVVVDNLVSGKKEYLNSQAKFYELDICSDSLSDIFINEKFDYVFHLAAQIDVRKSVENPSHDLGVNVLGGLNILANVHRHGVKKIIFSSTGGAIYGDLDQIPTPETALPAPMSPYGINKLCFEKYLDYYYQVYNQPYTALRFANVYGPRQFKGGEAGVVAIFCDNAVNGLPSIINGEGTQTRDFVYVGDIVAALIKAMESDFIGAVNIGTGQETNLLEIVSALEKALGEEIQKEHGPAKIGEQLRSCLDNSLARKVLGWDPKIGLEDGIKNTINWSKENK